MTENSLMKAQDVDGFETFEAGMEGDDRPQGAGVIQGAAIKFTNEAQWVDRAGEEVPQRVGVRCAVVVQHPEPGGAGGAAHGHTRRSMVGSARSAPRMKTTSGRMEGSQ